MKKKTSTTLQSSIQDDVFDYWIIKNSRIIDYGLSMTEEVPQKAPHSNNGIMDKYCFFINMSRAQYYSK